MDITVTFRHMEPIESLKIYAEEKVGKVKRFLDFPLEAHIVLSVEKIRHIADVTVSVNGTRIKAVEETSDMYSAIDKVMDKVETQVKKHIAKTRNHRTESAKSEGRADAEDLNDVKEFPEEESAIEVEKMVAKPMDPEEAAMQLSLLKQEFLVFRNAKSREINVIYKKNGGNMGLIEPSS